MVSFTRIKLKQDFIDEQACTQVLKKIVPYRGFNLRIQKKNWANGFCFSRKINLNLEVKYKSVPNT